MVMEFMEGGELFERIRKRVSFTEKEACEITKQVPFKQMLRTIKLYIQKVLSCPSLIRVWNAG